MPSQHERDIPHITSAEEHGKLAEGSSLRWRNGKIYRKIKSAGE